MSCLLGRLMGYGQADSGIVSNGHVSALVQSNGTMFSQKDGQAYNHFNTNKVAQLITYSGQWMVGVEGTTVYANKNDNWQKPQLWPGPIDTVTNLPKSAVEWSKIWTITRAEVQEHRNKFDETGYQMPSNITNWPAKHNDNNISEFMAPYIDWNINGVYDPENGDFPSFEGDYAAYFIANDLFGENVFPQANKLGIEIQGLVYAYNRSDLANTMFVKLYVINRSVNNYSPFFYGQYVDFQLGNPTDNVVATDVQRNLIYAYNGDDNDEDGFGKNLPSAGCIFLSHPLSASSLFTSTDSVRGLPKSEAEMLAVMNGKWRNNADKYAVGTGISGTSQQTTNYIYPKKTDPKVGDLNWSDENSGDTAGKRKMLGVIKFNDLKSKSYKRIDLAFVFAQDEENTEKKLQEQADQSTDFYKSTLGSSIVYTQQNLKVYPNPFELGRDKAFYINALSAQLVDKTGKMIVDLEPVDIYEKKFQIPCSEKLASGVYYLKAVTSSGLSYSKVILISNR